MTASSSTVRVAIVQAEVAPDLQRGLEITNDQAAEAARAGAALVTFPETWLPGYPAWLDVCRDAGLWDHPPVKAVYRRMAENSVVVDGASGHELGAIARRHRIAIVIGVVERVESGPARGTLFNTLLTYGPDPHGLRARRWTRVLGALDAAGASGAARLRRGHSHRRLADREGHAPDREPALRVRGPLLRPRGRLAHARIRAAAGARGAPGHRHEHRPVRGARWERDHR